MPEPRHSEAFLVDLRESWWNADWLELIAKRCALGEVRRALDVGAGHGHWTRVISRFFHPEAEVVGVERDEEWVRRANLRAPENQRFVVGKAEALPFPDASFDLVTCQTLLLHVPDPAAVLNEMRRVLRPRGQVLLAEPNNMPGSAALYASLPDADVEDVGLSVAWQARVERGKRLAGEGDNSIGERLVGLLAGWDDVRVWQNDRAGCFVPPYDAAAVEYERQFLARGETGWTRAESLRWFQIAGGDEVRYDLGLAAVLRLNRARLAAIDAGNYHAAEGSTIYLHHARKGSQR